MSGPSLALETLQKVHGAHLEESHQNFGDATARIAVGGLVEVMSFLRDEPALGFDMLMDLTAVDHHPKTPRFEAVYHLYSSTHGHRLRIKARLDDREPAVGSVTSLWASADWMEREVFDMYGIHFEGHPDLRRILLYDEFQGHPLRKDYPKSRRQPLIGPTDT